MFFYLPDCSLDVSAHPEGPATSHIDTGLLGFPQFSNKCSDSSKVHVATVCLSCSPPGFKFIKIELLCSKGGKLSFQIMQFIIN
jgi:hypothetical protein